MKAEEALEQSKSNYNSLVQKQIEWVDFKIKNAVKSGKDYVEGSDETLYPETISHFESLGYKAKNDFFIACPGQIGFESLDFEYWHISWEPKVDVT